VEALPKRRITEVFGRISAWKSESDASLYRVSIWFTNFVENFFNQIACDIVVIDNVRGGGGADTVRPLALLEGSVQAELDQKDPEGKHGLIAYEFVA
jgi:hypothetical protein